MSTRYAKKIKCCGRCLAVCFGIVCLSQSAIGTEVMTSSNTATWNRLHASSATLSWDWAWDWVPAEATSVRVTVRGARHRQVLNETFAKDGATSVALNVGTVTSESEDVYTATLTFLSGDGVALATRSADLYALAGSFSNARVCTQATEHPDWHHVKGPALIPYDAAWSETTAAATNGTLTVEPTGKPSFALPFNRQSGVFAVKGRNETPLTLAFDAVGAEPLTASVFWDVPGMLLMFR